MVGSMRSPAGDRLRSLGVAVGVALLGLGVGVVLVVGTLLGLRTAGVALTPLVVLVASLLLFQGVTMGGVAAAYVRLRGLTREYVGLANVFAAPARDGVVVVVGWGVALAAAVSGAVLVSAIGAEAGANQTAELAARDPDVLLLLIPGAFLLIGPGEELLFRGVVQGRLRESFGPTAGVGIAAVLFAAVHVAAVVGSPEARLVSVAVLLLPSLVFGAAYEFTGNLAVPALIHGAYDATLFGLLYLAVRFAGVDPTGGGSAVEAVSAVAAALAAGPW
jgi:membrane protease YdiL (CAAX protease family)